MRYRRIQDLQSVVMSKHICGGPHFVGISNYTPFPLIFFLFPLYAYAYSYNYTYTYAYIL
jgi:hypothetical protein